MVVPAATPRKRGARGGRGCFWRRVCCGSPPRRQRSFAIALLAAAWCCWALVLPWNTSGRWLGSGDGSGEAAAAATHLLSTFESWRIQSENSDTTGGERPLDGNPAAAVPSRTTDHFHESYQQKQQQQQKGPPKIQQQPPQHSTATATLDDSDNDNPDVVPHREPTHAACAHTDGVYHIAVGDIEGGVGTALFQLVVAQILYATATLNLTPWVHLQLGVSRVIEDPAVHGNNTTMLRPIQFTARVGRNVTRVQGRHWRDVTPGGLAPNDDDGDDHTPQQKLLQFQGTGIWGHYFEPVSDFVPGDRSCQDKLYVTLSRSDLDLIIPGLHGFAPHAVRCWRYDYLPEYAAQPHKSYHAWMAPQRARAAAVVRRSVRPRPYLVRRADAVWRGAACRLPDRPCLGLHVRHADKAAGRRVVPLEEFLPYAAAFVRQSRGGGTIYLATDSALVWREIQSAWPASVANAVRTSSDMVRSADATAVFDVAAASHHRTNQEVLVEILALSRCHALVHGHSAVSEAAIWNNLALHAAAVNLEDEDRLSPARFETLVQQMRAGEPPEQWPQPTRSEDHWPPTTTATATTAREAEIKKSAQQPQPQPQPTHAACDGYDGVLRIAAVGKRAATATALFTSVVNQLLFAQQHNLLPWVHLRPEVAPLLFDAAVHNVSATQFGKVSFQMMHGMDIGVSKHSGNDLNHSFYPTRPALREAALVPREFTVPPGNGIWDTYLEPVSEFVPGDRSCRDKPLLEMPEVLVSPGLQSFSPRSVKAWRYDNVPVSVLTHTVNATGSMVTVRSMRDWLEPMRTKAHAIVQQYFRFRPFLTERAEQVNPNVSPPPQQQQQQPCLGVHMRLADKKGNFRRAVRAGEYQDYIAAFERAGGQVVYVATDTQRPLQFIAKNFPERLRRLIRTQGEHLVRSVAGDWPTHELDQHHRVNSETLVDILALSKCSLLLHSYSTVAEAAIYLNPFLHGRNSVNLEDSNRMSAMDFEMLSRYVLGKDETLQEAPLEKTKREDIDEPSSFRPPRVEQNKNASSQCRSNAIIYLAQKVHSSYGRDSYSNLLRSLDLLNKNYLSINNHINNTDVFIFHTGGFNQSDLSTIESRLGPPSSAAGLVRLVDLSGTQFWARPRANAKDRPESWYAYPLFSEGYRRMMHWYAIDIWDFFDQWNEQSGCGYRYIFRLDEDSYIHSPIEYDIFEHMQSQQYYYGFRMCAYEMKVTQRMSTMWINRHANFVPQRPIDLQMCGFYNNFFVADLNFFRSAEVSKFLRFIDSQGHIYRRRLGDLMIHSMAAYWFAPPEHIHRFLDFTYEHGTFNETDGCLIWGGIQAGYNDDDAPVKLKEFYRKQTDDLGCGGINKASLREADLSPTYAHVPASLKGTLSIQTVTAGNVELPPGKGILSG